MDGRRPPLQVPRFHVVTDDAILADADFCEAAREVLEAGGSALALHVRGPRTTGRAVHGIVEELAPVAVDAGALLVVNDRVDIALAVGGVGAHLGARSLETSRVRRLVGQDVPLGRSVHSVDEAAAEADAGADYLLFGNVWSTPSHPDREGVGVQTLLRAVEAAGRVPVLAIGGVTPDRAAEVRQRAAAGVAVMRGVWGRAAPGNAVTEYISALGG